VDKQRLRAFLLGGAAGLIAGAIFAPRSGRELRGSIADRAGETREMGRETLFEARERLRERRAAVHEGVYRRVDDADGAGGGAGPDAAPLSVGEEASQDPVPRRPGPRPRRDDVVSLPFDDPPGENAEREAERSEELRRKVRETRARLSERLDAPRGEGPQR
jgi:hypothetical protein